MPKDVSDRRARTHDLFVIEGRDRDEVVARITDEFEVAEATVRDDLRSIEEWVGDLIQSDPTCESRLRELRQARGRLYDLALDAREAGDSDLERKIVGDIVSSIATDLELSQSLGLTVDVEAVEQVALPEDVDADDPLTGLADRDPAVVSTSR